MVQRRTAQPVHRRSLQPSNSVEVAEIDEDALDQLEVKIKKDEDEDIFLIRAEAEATRDRNLYGNEWTQDDIRKRADELRKFYRKRFRNVKEAVELKEKEQALRERELVIEKREAEHERILKQIREEIKAGKEGRSVMDPQVAQAAIHAVLDNNLDRLIKLRSTVIGYAQAKTLLLSIAMMPVALLITFITFFLPAESKPWVLMPTAIVILIVGWHVIKRMNKSILEFGIITEKELLKKEEQDEQSAINDGRAEPIDSGVPQHGHHERGTAEEPDGINPEDSPPTVPS